MKTSFKDQYDNWYRMITTIISPQCVRAAESTVTVSIQKLLKKEAINRLRFSDLTQLSVFLGHDLGFKSIFGFGSGSGLN